MPSNIEDLKLEYSIRVSVDDTEIEYPDPETAHDARSWVESLRTLNEEILKGNEARLLVSTRAPGNGGTNFGKNEVGLATKHLAHAPWLAKGYADWALGVKSTKVDLEQLDMLATLTIKVMTQWFEGETRRQSK